MGWAPAFGDIESRVVEWYGEVESEGGHGDVDAKSKTDAYGYFLEEGIPFEFAVRVQVVVGVDEPDVAQVGEECALEDACDGESLFLRN